jgi:hypothetical protein
LEQDPDIKPVICVGKKQKNCCEGAGQVFADLPGGLLCRSLSQICSCVAEQISGRGPRNSAAKSLRKMSGRRHAMSDRLIAKRVQQIPSCDN